MLITLTHVCKYSLAEVTSRILLTILGVLRWLVDPLLTLVEVASLFPETWNVQRPVGPCSDRHMGLG